MENKSISSQRRCELVVVESNYKVESCPEEENDNFLSEIKKEENNKKEIDQLETEEDAKKSFFDVPHNQIYKSRNTFFNRHLLPLRIAVVFMYGGGSLPLFLSVFLRNRGMSLIELSSVISATSFSQFLCASVSGVIADKTGNSKPVLIFLMTATVIACACLLLIPSMTHDACEILNIDFNSLNHLHNAAKDSDLDNCTYTCPANNKDFQPSNVLNETLITESGINIKVYLSFENLFNQTKSDDNFSVDFHLLNTSAYANLTKNCSLACSVSQKDCQTKEITLLIIYAFVTFSFLTFCSTTYRFMDVTIMLLVKEHNSNYGQERVFAVISETIVSILVAFGLDLVDSGIFSRHKYDLVFWIFTALMILSIIASCNFKAKINAPSKQLNAKAFILVKNVEFIVFLMVIFTAGFINNFYMYFKLWLIEDLKADKMLLGLNNAIFSLCSVPGLLTSKWWLQKLGTNAIILIFLFSNFLIGFGYFYLNNPWLSLILEGARGFWYNLFMVAYLQHCHDIAPLGLVSTVSAVSGAIHFACGRTAATLGGGLLINAVGPKTTFKLIATVSLTTAIAYSVFIFMCRRKELIK